MLEPTLAEHLTHVQWAGPCATCNAKRDLVTVNTVPFDVLSVDTFTSRLDQFCDCGSSHVVHFLAVHPTVVARQVPAYRELLSSGDLVVSDGAPIVVAMRANGRRAKRVTSTDGFYSVCAAGVKRSRKHYFVGGATQAVADAISANLLHSFPEIAIAGFEVPPFRPYTDEEFAALTYDIVASGADIVWVGLGAPKQDVLAHRLRLAGVAPVIVTIGATFDFVAGTKSRAPKWLRLVGMEWFYRMMLEPRRLWRRYLVGNASFIASTVRDSLRRPRRSHSQ